MTISSHPSNSLRNSYRMEPMLAAQYGNRRGLPKGITSAKLKEKGDLIQRQKGNLVATTWHKRAVILLTTNASPNDSTSVQQKQKIEEHRSVPYPRTVKTTQSTWMVWTVQTSWEQATALEGSPTNGANICCRCGNMFIIRIPSVGFQKEYVLSTNRWLRL